MLKAFQRLQRAHCASSYFRLGAQSAGMLKPLNSTNTWMLVGSGKSRFLPRPSDIQRSSILCPVYDASASLARPVWRGHSCPRGLRSFRQCGTKPEDRPRHTTSSALRRVWRRRSLHIHMQLQRRINSRWMAVSIRVVVRRALRREALPLRRLRKLPDFGKADPTLRRSRWPPRKRASRRGRTNVVGDKESNFSSARVLPNVVGSHDTDFTFSCRNSRAIDPRTKSGGSHGVHPCVDVSLLLGQHSPAFFNVEKNSGARWKALSPGRCDRGLPIRATQRRRVMLQLFVKAAVEENKKSKSRRLKLRTLPCPGIRLSARRVVEPVSGKREGLPQSVEVRIAGIVVAVKAEIRGHLPDGRRRKDRDANQEWGSKKPHHFSSLRSLRLDGKTPFLTADG